MLIYKTIHSNPSYLCSLEKNWVSNKKSEKICYTWWDKMGYLQKVVNEAIGVNGVTSPSEDIKLPEATQHRWNNVTITHEENCIPANVLRLCE